MVLSLSSNSHEKGLGKAEPDRTTAIWLALNQRHNTPSATWIRGFSLWREKKTHQTIPEYSINKKVHIITNMARK